MSLRICLHLPRKNGGHKLADDLVCFDIPVLIDRRPPPENSHPVTWLTGHGVRPEAVRDLQVLASIQSLASQLPERPRLAMQEVVRAEVGQVQLPEGLLVHF